MSGCVAAWLRALPPDAVVAWFDDAMGAGRPFTHGWVDVQVHALEQACGLNWVWTVVAPDEEPDGVDEGMTIRLAPDVEVLVGEGDDGSRARPLTVGRPRPDEGWQPGWSVAALDAALARWARVVAGRRDVSFRWAPEHGSSRMLARVIDDADHASGA